MRRKKFKQTMPGCDFFSTARGPRVPFDKLCQAVLKHYEFPPNTTEFYLTLTKRAHPEANRIFHSNRSDEHNEPLSFGASLPYYGITVMHDDGLCYRLTEPVAKWMLEAYRDGYRFVRVQIDV